MSGQEADQDQAEVRFAQSSWGLAEGPERQKSTGSPSLSAVVEIETSLLDTLTVTVADSFEDLATDCR